MNPNLPSKNLLVFSIFDLATRSHGSPFCCRTLSEALRSVSHTLTNAPKDSPYVQSPADYQLFLLGTYDPDTGSIISKVELIDSFHKIAPTNIDPRQFDLFTAQEVSALRKFVQDIIAAEASS